VVRNSEIPLPYFPSHWGRGRLEVREDQLEKLGKRIQRLKEKRPGYGEILEFYLKVREEQEKIKLSSRIKPILLKKEWKDLLTKEGFPLLQREDFPLDIEASVILFQSLCQIGKEANPYMSKHVNKIEEIFDKKRINLKELLKEGLKGKRIDQIADELRLDKKVFLFLIQSSIRPSIEAGVEQLRSELDPETWLKGYCPICGSLPYLSLLKDEVGKRYLLCSFCGYQWRIERLICPFCNNKEQGALQYIYGEGEEAYRIDLCDKCHQYIKTIDLRKLEETDPSLEDLATLHLDILASQKGYKRPVPNPWIT
jgi:FdhE protein